MLGSSQGFSLSTLSKTLTTGSPQDLDLDLDLDVCKNLVYCTSERTWIGLN